jgi:hypothetical protein
MPFLEHYISLPLIKNIKFLMLLLKCNIFGTILNTQNIQETNIHKNLLWTYVRHPATLIWFASWGWEPLPCVSSNINRWNLQKSLVISKYVFGMKGVDSIEYSVKMEVLKAV